LYRVEGVGGLATILLASIVCIGLGAPRRRRRPAEPPASAPAATACSSFPTSARRATAAQSSPRAV